MNVTSRPGAMPPPSMLPPQAGRGSASRGTAASGSDSPAAAASATAASSSATTAASSSPATAGVPALPAAFPMPLSTAQFAQRSSAAAPPSLASLDSDGDGSVSASEYGLADAGALGQQLFVAVDSDGNGQLGGDEIRSFESELAQPAGAPVAGDPVVAALDSDGDGAISSTEFGLDGAQDGNSVQDLFKLIDRDGNGSLSGGEMASFRDEVQQAMAAEAGPVPTVVAGSVVAAGATAGLPSDQDLQVFLQQLANQYADLAADLGDAAASLVDLRA